MPNNEFLSASSMTDSLCAADLAKSVTREMMMTYHVVGEEMSGRQNGRTEKPTLGHSRVEARRAVNVRSSRVEDTEWLKFVKSDTFLICFFTNYTYIRTFPNFPLLPWQRYILIVFEKLTLQVTSLLAGLINNFSYEQHLLNKHRYLSNTIYSCLL